MVWSLYQTMPNAPDHDRIPFDWTALVHSTAHISGNPVDPDWHAASVPGGQLFALFKMAGLLEISWEHLAHPGLEETGNRLQQAAKHFSLAPGIGLEEWFWSNPRDLWSQPVARQFASQKTPSTACPHGFLCTYAQDAGPNGLFWYQARPVLSRDHLCGNFRAGGPYMALLCCEAAWTGRVEATGGFVQPILSAQVAFPVNCALERTVLAMLLKVVERLDACGLDMTVSRELGPLGPADEITLCLGRHGQVLREVGFTCADRPDDSAPEIYQVTPAKLENHSFLNWLTDFVQA